MTLSVIWLRDFRATQHGQRAAIKAVGHALVSVLNLSGPGRGIMWITGVLCAHQYNADCADYLS